ncbi:Solute carrier family 35 member F6 [Picochlorum sp. SENEW3]|nr:Solute carrier family 35 member F6 [Picochlorum sp. SENEW3]
MWVLGMGSFPVPVAVLAAAMLISGACITVLIKLQDLVPVYDEEEGRDRRFRHPIIQTGLMFLGEVLCLVSILWNDITDGPVGKRGKRLLTFWGSFAIPAVCDFAASTLINLGLFYTSASTYQMLKGNVVCFAGIWTVLLLHKRLKSQHWMGIVMITAGAALVGASSMYFDDGHFETLLVGGKHAPNKTGLGILLIVIAQMLNALQFIAEEKFMKKLRPPPGVAVGIEGLTGMICCLLCLPFVSTIMAPDGRPIDRVMDGITAIQGSQQLQITSILLIFCVAVFNLSGISVTRRLSGAARAVFDVSRTVLVWIVGIKLGWESFHTLQAVGFSILVAGTSVYNDVLRNWLPEPNSYEGYSNLNADLLPPDGSWSTESEGDDNDDASTTITWNSMDEERQQHRRDTQPILTQNRNAATMARSISMLPEILSPHSPGSL